jgi:GxxExxY protein
MLHINEISQEIIGKSFTVYNTLGSGFMEKVYENALVYELRKDGLFIEQQRPIEVYYEGQVVGSYFSDILVEGRVLVEVKAIKEVDKIHFVQVLNYLKCSEVKLGLLINFSLTGVKVKRIVNGLIDNFNT